MIIIKGKSIFLEKWLNYLSDLFDSTLKMYSYDSFISKFSFAINYKYFFFTVIKAIHSRLIHLMHSQLSCYKVDSLFLVVL